MDFAEAEEKFQDLQARIQRGEPLSEEQYQEEMQKLMVQDDQGTFWSLEPGTGQWLYFDGTEWVPGVPPTSGVQVEPGPVISPYEVEGRTEPPGGGREAGPLGVGGQPQGVEADNVPTYIRTGDTPQTIAERAGGIPPRPVRGAAFGLGEENTPWLPFAIGAVVLLLCAVGLFFGVKNLPFIGTAAARATPTQVSEEVPTPTLEEELPTETPEPEATAEPSPTASVVKVTLKERLRVRGGPGTTFPVLATLDAGTEVTPVGRNEDSSWIQIQQPGKTDLGWVTAEFVEVKGDVNSLPVAQSDGAAPGKPTPTETPAG